MMFVDASTATRVLLRCLAYIVLPYIAVFVAPRLYTASRLRKFHRVGIDPGPLGIHTKAAKDEFYKSGYDLVKDGYSKYKNEPFVVQTGDMERLIVPMHYVEQTRNLPTSQLSVKSALLERFLAEYTGMDAVQHNDTHRDVCKIQLTQNIGALLPRMKKASDLYIQEALADVEKTGSAEMPAYGLVLSAIGRITSTVVVDDPVSQNKDWNATVVQYPAHGAMLSSKLRLYTPYIRPVVYYLHPERHQVNNHIKVTKQTLGPIVDKRRSGQADRKLDIIQWLSDAEPDEKSENVVGKVLFLLIAAVHTSTMSLAHALLDLAVMPELLQELRSEAQQVLSSGWTIQNLHRLRKMDSFLKESHRFNSPGVLNYNRLLKQDVRLQDGTVLPKGVIISSPSAARSKDDKLFASASEMQPLRFYHAEKALKSDKESGQYLFTSTAGGDSWFGYGPQSCPGRWYAEAQIKLVLATLILNYNVAYPNGQKTRAKNLMADEKIMPDTQQKIVFTKAT